MFFKPAFPSGPPAFSFTANLWSQFTSISFEGGESRFHEREVSNLKCKKTNGSRCDAPRREEFDTTIGAIRV
jgi:hypothetical protein